MIKKRILITGANGLLGQRFVKFYKENKSVMLKCISFSDSPVIEGIDYSKVDIRDKKQIKKAILDFYPDVIINSAAYTHVDKSEDEKDDAWQVNVNAVEYMIKYAKVTEAKIVQVSTDYVFDGTEGPYSEDKRVCPVNYYGRTKLASENLLIAAGIDHLIIRTNVLYGKTADNKPDFVTFVFKSLSEGKPISIVDDQLNNPTFTDDIVFGIHRLLEFKKKGIYNIAGPEVISRYEFAKRIAEYYYLDTELISKVKTSEFKQKAQRPLRSGLLTLKAETEIGYKPHTYEQTFHLIENYLFNQIQNK